MEELKRARAEHSRQQDEYLRLRGPYEAAKRAVADARDAVGRAKAAIYAQYQAERGSAVLALTGRDGACVLVFDDTNTALFGTADVYPLLKPGVCEAEVTITVKDAPVRSYRGGEPWLAGCGRVRAKTAAGLPMRAVFTPSLVAQARNLRQLRRYALEGHGDAYSDGGDEDTWCAEFTWRVFYDILGGD
jgi:hypothetical protein